MVAIITKVYLLPSFPNYLRQHELQKIGQIGIASE